MRKCEKIILNTIKNKEDKHFICQVMENGQKKESGNGNKVTTKEETSEQ